MEVFSAVIAEISSTVCALLSNDEYSYRKRQDRTDTFCDGALPPANEISRECAAEYDRVNEPCPDDRVATFLNEKLKELNVSVVVTSETSAESDAASLVKLCGTWRDICAVHIWLMQFIQASEKMPPVTSAPPLASDITHGSTEMKECTEFSATRSRCSLRKHCSARQELLPISTLLSSVVSPTKPTKAKQLKRNAVLTRRRKVRPRNSTESKTVISQKHKAVVAFSASPVTEEYEINVTDSVTSCTMLSSEQTNDSLVLENDGSSGIQILVESANGMSCTDFREQSNETADADQSEGKLAGSELQCDLCDYVTKKQRSLVMHTARMHGERSHVCPTCNHTFAIAKDLTQHMKFHIDQYCCEQCGRTLKSKYALALHTARIHNGATIRTGRWYLCTLCGKMCRSKTDYNVHRNKHTGVRPFHCDICNANFFSRANLRAHRQIHSDARVFECKQCGKAFKQRQGLRIHLAVHSAERPYKCNTCGKAFTQRGALLRHARTHTSVRPYMCCLCPSAFNDRSVLRRHMIGIHKLQDATLLRHSLHRACTEARQAEHSNLDQFGKVQSVGDTNNTLAYVDTTRTYNLDDVTPLVAVSDNIMGSIPVKQDMQLNSPAGQPLLVQSSPPCYATMGVSATDHLPQNFLLDSWSSSNTR